MLERGELVVCRQTLKRLSPQDRLGLPAQIVPPAVRVEHHKPTVDEPLAGLRFLIDFPDERTGQAQFTEAARWANSGHCSDLAVGPMKSHQGAEVDVSDAVAIGDTEDAVSFQVLPD